MGNDTFQLRCFREISFTDQLMNISCKEGEKLKPFYGGGGGGGKGGGDNCIYTATFLRLTTGRFQTLI